MDKEYISTIVIDSESAAKGWRDLPKPKKEDVEKTDPTNKHDDGEFSGVSTWVS